MNKLEKEVERELRLMVAKHGGKCLKWVCPGWSGVPDRLILLPGGRVLFVETKRPKGGETSAMQQWWGEQIRSLGFTWMVVRDHEDIVWLELLISNYKESRL